MNKRIVTVKRYLEEAKRILYSKYDLETVKSYINEKEAIIEIAKMLQMEDISNKK